MSSPKLQGTTPQHVGENAVDCAFAVRTPLVLRAEDVARFQTFGFLVLRRFFEPAPLADEIDRVMNDGLLSSHGLTRSGQIHFQYVPMMTSRTPASLSLLDRTEAIAVAVLGGAVLPTRAKGVRYFGNSPWHVDSELPVPSIGILAYLGQLAPENGALMVLPGSHRPEFSNAIREYGGFDLAASAMPSHAIRTEPGDVIAIDEHLFHASTGGIVRRQWRTDFVVDPIGREAEAQTERYYAGILPPDWDGGYDVDRYPSYGLDWRQSGRPAVARLESLGVYELAGRQEEIARSRWRREVL